MFTDKDVKSLRRINPDRVRRHMARSTPDAVWETFDPHIDSEESRLREWQRRWCERMRIKHAGERGRLDAFQSEIYNATGKFRVQLVYVP